MIAKKCQGKTGRPGWSDRAQCRFNVTQGDYCKLHDPERVKARREKNAQRVQEQIARELASTVVVGLINATDAQLITECKRRGLFLRVARAAG